MRRHTSRICAIGAYDIPFCVYSTKAKTGDVPGQVERAESEALANVLAAYGTAGSSTPTTAPT